VTNPFPTAIAVLTCLALAPGAALAQPESDLGRHFGFEAPRILVLDSGAGPMTTADINADGLMDLLVVNNRSSRIEIFLQRRTTLTDAELERAYRVNDLAPSRHYERVEVSVPHRVMAAVPHDVDRDGRMDIIYAGQPAELVWLQQQDDGSFSIEGRRRVRGLAATRTALAVADVEDRAGSNRDDPEVVTIAEGRLAVFPLSRRGRFGEPTMLGAPNAQLVASFVEDYDGDGMLDIMAIAPDADATIRLWLQREIAGAGDSPAGPETALGPEARFETPALWELEPVRFDDRKAASIGTIERTSRRIVFYDLMRRPVDEADSSASAAALVTAFDGGSPPIGGVAVTDVNGDGLTDLIAVEPARSRVTLRLQAPNAGLGVADAFSAFKQPAAVAAGQWNGSGPAEVFVLSEEEKAVGVSEYDPARKRLNFPQPIALATAGATPVCLGWFETNTDPALAVVVKERRDHALEIHRPDIPPRTIELEGMRRSPEAILVADLDGDGGADLLLLTPEEPLVLIRDAGGENAEVVTEREMPQFGLVETAGPGNALVMDVNDDGRDELLISEANFVRACAFDAEQGWRVMDQATHPDASTRFTALAARKGEAGALTLLAADTANERIVEVMAGPGPWSLGDAIEVGGLDARLLFAGDFSGGADDNAADLLLVGEDAFAVVRMAGDRLSLEPFATYRSDVEQRLEHEMSTGDLNGDGYVDVVVLDAQEQMCQILTFSAARRLYDATEFKVYESRLFTGGAAREFEPSDAAIADVTADGANDLILMVHDRVMIYPQMTRQR